MICFTWTQAEFLTFGCLHTKSISSTKWFVTLGIILNQSIWKQSLQRSNNHVFILISKAASHNNLLTLFLISLVFVESAVDQSVSYYLCSVKHLSPCGASLQSSTFDHPCCSCGLLPTAASLSKGWLQSHLKHLGPVLRRSYESQLNTIQYVTIPGENDYCDRKLAKSLLLQFLVESGSRVNAVIVFKQN